MLKPLSYSEVLAGMMKDNQCTLRQALCDDLYGIRNVKKYLKAYQLDDNAIQFYLNVAVGKEPDMELKV